MFVEANFENEQEIEDVVIKNADYFFGPSSIFIPKRTIQTNDGARTIPDGFAIDLASRTWYIVEVELNRHGVWQHIAPQVVKQITAGSMNETKRMLEDIVIDMYDDDNGVKERFEREKIKVINIRKILGEIFNKLPIIGLPIDKISEDLKSWALGLRNEVKLWLVEKYVDFDNPENIQYKIPEECRPSLDTTAEGDENRTSTTDKGHSHYGISINDLLDEKLLSANEVLVFNYKSRKKYKGKVEAIVTEKGNLDVLNRSFKSPSSAGLFAIHSTGDTGRLSVNGWAAWQNADGEFLSDLRDKCIKQIS